MQEIVKSRLLSAKEKDDDDGAFYLDQRSDRMAILDGHEKKLRLILKQNKHFETKNARSKIQSENHA